MTDDPYLRPLLDAVDEFHVVIGVQDQMRQLILKAYQQGRARVIRDVAEEEKAKKNRDITVQFADIRAQLAALEQAYLKQLQELRLQKEELLTPEEMADLIRKMQKMVLKQARRNR